MNDNLPTPPAELPRDVVDALEQYSPELFRHIASYADELAEHRERNDRFAKSEDGGKKRHDELPDDVPSKATITIKEINDNRYYYWQWRDGDSVSSKYKGPVGPDE
jgi:hypothetical protein